MSWSVISCHFARAWRAFTPHYRFAFVDQVGRKPKRKTACTYAKGTSPHINGPSSRIHGTTGSFEDWYSFKDTFEKLIHQNGDVSVIEKFHYLRSSLKDKAAEIIQSLDTTTDNYDDAWAAVKNRYDNKRWTIQRHIKAIFDAPAINKENHLALRELLDTIFKHLRALKALDRPTESWDDLIVHIVVSKLDIPTSKAWEISLDDDVPDLKTLMQFLSKRCQALEAIHAKTHNNATNNTQKQGKHKGTSVANVATSNLSCPLCKENHQLYHCEEFLKLTVEDRIKNAKKAHLCINCLRSTTHQSKLCKSSACRKCSKKHNTLLHMSTTDNADQSLSNTRTPPDKTTDTPLPVSTQCISSYHPLNVLLSTAIVNIYDSNNKPLSCRALLDSGSQMNFITQEFADKLQLKERFLEMSVSGVMQGVFRAKSFVNIRVKSRFNNFSENIDCVILPKITQHLPQHSLSIQSFTIPKNIKLADPNFNVPSSIDMLIGAELFWRIICAGQIKQSKNLPILQKTHFGWVVSGCTAIDMAGQTPSVNLHLTVSNDLSQELNRFWEVDHNISSHTLTSEERTCKELFLKGLRRNSEGRFIVKLPIKQDMLDKLGNSKDIALRRFKALEARLITQPDMYSEYKKFMQEYIDLGHMREVDESTESTPSQSYYLPHHAVRKETSTTTKFRVVFNASSKTDTGISLNDVLMVGPNQQEDLFSILVRFRTFLIALTADVVKMYRQVLVDPTHTPLQRIFWRKSINELIKIYELLTVTYGTASAAFEAIESMRKLAEEYKERYPVASEILLRDFYVDDLVSGANTIQEALTIKNQLTQLLQEGKFELRKWASNEPSLQGGTSSVNQKEFILAADKETETRTLGILWDCNSDTFKFSSINCPPPIENPTKRSILSRIALIFDPLGLLGPVTLVAKIIMQDLWRLKLNWDESIPLDLNTKWKQYEGELQDLRSISIPRRVITADQPTHLELHGFSDASEVGYGACIYLRSTSASGEHFTNLLCSKSRVAPLKNLSLARLELSAALLLAQLYDKITKCLNCKIDFVSLNTDSKIVLAWLQSCSRSWATFVANRVGEIQHLTPIQYWNHVSSEDNPADPLSRGVMPNALPSLKIWWTGPIWLSYDKEQWPQPSTSALPEELPEKRSKMIATTLTNTEVLDIFNRYSKFTKLVRVVAYMLRFFENARNLKASNNPVSSLEKKTRTVKPILPEELNHVIIRLVKLIQAESFPEDIKSLAVRGVVSKGSPILKLNPFIDDSGILRVGGRIKSSFLPYAAKHPMLLPGHHSFSHLIIRHEHEAEFHAGPQATLAAIRQKYWLISARNVIRQIVRKCVTCFRSSPKPASTLMGNLPESRVNIPKKVFDKCGVDYAGPLYYKEGIRRNAKLIKCYIAIFVCFATKAVHIELASSLSSEAFLGVFRRFVSRRGCPSDIFSDNGLNFVGADRELRELADLIKNQAVQQQVIDQATSKGVNWHFIPPRSPHHGGLWEAAVKSAKRHLIKMTKDSHLRYEELETLLIQIEAILNSRPLTPVSSDSNDFIFLTPGHFLIGAPITSYPEPSLEEIPLNRLSRWQHVQQLRQHFWRRWSREYLHQCQQRNKWHTQDASIHIGQMVILKEDNTPPLSWPLGRIQELHIGGDGIARVATIRTMNGSYKRPITRLCLLPIEDSV
ncbi:uncharacterized protein LOC143899738 [Temnothorax americanus]|uniref:uncharacterized protein LOC143899738 n=1 Tax=Temnothorax americanus TaxID=1964332 RepID=UPI0040688C22